MADRLNLVFILVVVISANTALKLNEALHYSGWVCRNPNTRDPSDKFQCSCESTCDIYGDCCIDSEYFLPEKQVWGASPLSCRFLSYASFYVMASCPPQWGKDDTLESCESPSNNYRDPMLDVPVTSVRTNITYLNGHCAVCHEDFEPNDDIIWNLKFECFSSMPFPIDFTNYANYGDSVNNEINSANSKNFNVSGNFAINFTLVNASDNYDIEQPNIDYNLHNDIFTSNYSLWNYSVQSFPENASDTDYVDHYFNYPYATETENKLSDLFYEEQTGIWKINTNNTKHKCSVTLQIPIITHGVLKKCNPMLIGTCARNWTDENIRKKCNSYTDVWCHHWVYYRNPYCALCNYVNESDFLSCYTVSVRNHIGMAWPNSDFSILLDWRSLQTHNKCSSGQKYDLVKEKCRSFSKRKEEKPGSALDYITLIFICISILFLVLHLAAFFATPKLRNLPAMNLACLCISLFFLYSFFIASGFTEPPCMALAVTMHYSLLSTFSWMLVISFDIWRVIKRSTKSLRFSSGNNWKRFCLYCLAAWSLPATLVSISLTLDLTEVETDFAPGYGSTNCWIQNGFALLLFVVAPLCIAMAFNLCFYTWTGWLIHTTKSETVKKSTARTDFRLFMRLALIMGLTWITGIAAGFTGVRAFWYIFVVLNTLQGLFIFIAFTCTKKMWKELKRRMHHERSLDFTSRTTRTSQGITSS